MRSKTTSGVAEHRSTLGTPRLELPHVFGGDPLVSPMVWMYGNASYFNQLSGSKAIKFALRTGRIRARTARIGPGRRRHSRVGVDLRRGATLMALAARSGTPPGRLRASRKRGPTISQGLSDEKGYAHVQACCLQDLVRKCRGLETQMCSSSLLKPQTYSWVAS